MVFSPVGSLLVLILTMGYVFAPILSLNEYTLRIWLQMHLAFFYRQAKFSFH